MALCRPRANEYTHVELYSIYVSINLAASAAASNQDRHFESAVARRRRARTDFRASRRAIITAGLFARSEIAPPHDTAAASQPRKVVESRKSVCRAR